MPNSRRDVLLRATWAQKHTPSLRACPQKSAAANLCKSLFRPHWSTLYYVLQKNGKIQTKKATRLKKQNKKNCNVRFEGGITCVISKFWKIVPSDVNQFESERIYKQKKKAQVKASYLIPNPNMDKVCWKCTHNLQMLKTGGNACLSH